VRYTYGPMAKALVPSTIAMEAHEIAVSIETAGPYGTRMFRRGPSPRFRPDLAPEERAALDTVLTLTRELTANETIEIAYNTAPMRVILRLEEGRSPMLNVEVPFDLDDEIVRESITPVEPQKTPEEMAAFRRHEFERVADLMDSAAFR